MLLADRKQSFCVLLHDRNSKFRGAFDEVFRSEGVTIIRTPVRARTQTRTPSAGSVTVRRECLDRILIVNRRHLENVLRAYTARASAYSST
jgi:hypothetical protein